MGKYFGTDGVRGVANVELDAMLAYRTGLAAAKALAEEKSGRPRFVIGKDTRISCDMLEAAITAGLCAAGADVEPLGILPTPAVAYLTVATGADAGIVISASHNPYEHNGIKIFNENGYKLSDELEAHIEELIDGEVPVSVNEGIGRIKSHDTNWIDNYIEHIKGYAEGELTKIRAVIDCANGASVRTAAAIFEGLLGEVKFLGNKPDGININEACGSLHTEALAKTVIAEGFDIGIAFDGDADRCIIIDEHGETVDGDKIMAVCALAMQANGTLRHNSLAMTVMSNHGLHEFAKNHGITLHETSVGDRYVLERMLKEEISLGGEQSGHIIFLENATTGDGQLAAIKFLSALATSGQSVSQLVSVMRTYPQVLQNTVIEGGESVKDALVNDEILAAAVRETAEKLGDSGRVVVRPSGTEPLFRVMIQAREEKIANKYASDLTELIKSRAKSINN